MQQTETSLDWRLPEDLAATNRPRHFLFCGPDHTPHRQHQQQTLHGPPSVSSRHIHHIHHHHAFAVCGSFVLSHRHRRALGKQNKTAAAQRPQTLGTSRCMVIPGLLALQRFTKQRTRTDGCRVISVRLRPPRFLQPSLPSMQRTPLQADRSAQDIRAIISNVVPPHAAISSVQLLPHHRLQQVYEVKLSDMTTMLVVLPPLPVLRLLRSEQNRIKSEAVVVRWIRGELLQPPPAAVLRPTEPCLPRQPAAHCPFVQDPKRTVPLGRHTVASKTATSPSPPAALRADLLPCLPSPVSLFSPSPTPVGARSLAISAPSLTFNVFQPPPGTPIAALPSPLTPAERMSVDYQAGRLLRQLSQLAPKSGNFGPALAVLDPQSMPGSARANDPALGMGSWSVAFHSILESILRDGEDVAVALAYPAVRKHFRRLGHLLDAVTTPSLVIVDAMDDSNLLVQRAPARPGPEATTDRPTKQRSESPACSETNGVSLGDSARSHSIPPLHENRASFSPPFAEPPAGIAVTGLRDWSHCIFGDPLFALVFCEHPSASFLGGFHSAEAEGSQPSGSLTCQEEGENRAVRLLLYQCYHAVVQIVRGFYRPGRDQTAQELAARKRLTEILAKLDAVDEDPKRRFRHRRPSGTMSPAKKPRSESGDETPKR